VYGVVTDDLIENLIALVEFVEDLPSDLEQCKEKVRSVSYDSDLFDRAINQGLDRAIGYVKDFVNTLENPDNVADKYGKAEKKSVLDEMRNEFIDRYPHNYANELELGGRCCVFSLNEILRIIDKYKED